MNCTTCNYSLWNNTNGLCPECGTAFKPSDFEFVPGAVRFLCPFCSQQYFGTDSRGHLEPRAFACVRCQQPLEMDSMLLTPEVGLSESATQAPEVAWTNVELGFFARWWKTVSAAMIRPHILGAGIRPGAGAWSAWWFAIFTNAVIALASWGALLILFLGIFAVASGFGGGRGGRPPIWAFGMGFGFLALFTVVVYPVFILVWGLGAHLIMSLGDTKPAHSLKHTYATICYASGANAVNMIPCIGSYIALGGIWWMVAATISLKFSQKVSTLKAIAAAIVPPTVVLGTCTALYFGFIYAMMNKVSAAAVRATTVANLGADKTFTSAITTALCNSSNSETGWPSHVAELVLSNTLSTSSFTLSASGTSSNTIPVLGTTLAQAILLPTLEEKRMLAGLAALKLPPIYRFGDFVFTYQGIPAVPPLGQDTSTLWIVISSLDSTSPPLAAPVIPFGFPAPSPTVATTATATPPRTIYVGLVNGSVTAIDPVNFAAELAIQNALRATFGLTPITAPETLKQWTPSTEPESPEPPS